MIFVRRSDDKGNVHLLGTAYPVDRRWLHRLVRCEVDFPITASDSSPYGDVTRIGTLLRESPYHRPNKPFQGQP